MPYTVEQVTLVSSELALHWLAKFKLGNLNDYRHRCACINFNHQIKNHTKISYYTVLYPTQNGGLVHETTFKFIKKLYDQTYLRVMVAKSSMPVEASHP